MTSLTQLAEKNPMVRSENRPPGWAMTAASRAGGKRAAPGARAHHRGPVDHDRGARRASRWPHRRDQCCSPRWPDRGRSGEADHGGLAAAAMAGLATASGLRALVTRRPALAAPSR